MKKLLMIQPGLHGDVIVCLPIARHFHRLGYQVSWPMPDGWSYRALMKRISYVRPVFIASHDSSIFGPIHDMADNGDFDKIVDTSSGMMGSRTKSPSPDMSFVAYKYKAAGVPLTQRYNLKWSRNLRAEEAVYRQVVGKLGDYCLVHDTTWAGTHQFTENGLPFVKFRPVGKFSIFDWYKIAIRAKEIKCIDSSLANFIETIHKCTNIKKEVVLRSVFPINSIYRSNWKVVQGNMPYPPGKVLYRVRRDKLEIPINHICGNPPISRGEGAVMVYNRKTGRTNVAEVKDLPSLLGTRRVFINKSSVRKSVISLHRDTGHRIGCTLIRQLNSKDWVAVLAGRSGLITDGKFTTADRVPVSVVGPWKVRGTFVVRTLGNLDLMVHGSRSMPAGVPTPRDDRDWKRYESVLARPRGSLVPDTSAVRLSNDIVRRLCVETVIYHSDLSCFSGEDGIKEEYWADVDSGPGIAVGAGALKAVEAAARTGKNHGWTNCSIFGLNELFKTTGLLTYFPLMHDPDFRAVQLLIGYKESFKVYRRALKKGFRMWLYGDLLLVL